MAAETLAAALEREHREIDAGIERFLATRTAAEKQGGEPGEDQLEPLRQAMSALRRHIYLEEEFVFPPLDKHGLVAPIFVMLREHGEIWDTMDAIDALLAGGGVAALGEESCRQLLAQLEQHNLKEEAIIYPPADAALSADTLAELHAFLASGQMPQGWVCKRAGA